MPSSSIHSRDPLHGITLESIIQQMVARHGWTKMGERIPIRCFQINPSVKSSLAFLRKTPWARRKVESWFIEEFLKKGGYGTAAAPTKRRPPIKSTIDGSRV